LSSKNSLVRCIIPGKNSKKREPVKVKQNMKQRRKLKRTNPRSVIQLAGNTIQAGAVIVYRFIRILSFPSEKTGGIHIA